MSLKLMFITNKPNIAKLAQDSGVDRIWIDLEYIGKDERQKGLDTVKSKHEINDILLIKPILNKAELLVRINPIHENTEREIEDVISNGADIIMLPMFRTKDEVYKFLKIVNGRVKTSLLVETKDAVNNIDEILKLKGIDEIHIGLNDLHLEYKKTFMFEMLIDEIVKNLCVKCREYGIPYGIGGIARIGLGSVPAEYILGEHYNLKSSAAILSRSFCNANLLEDTQELKEIFSKGIREIREKENEIKRYTDNDYLNNYHELKNRIELVVIKGKK